MRHLLALSAVLLLAGVCLAAEFKSDEAKKAQADYAAALDAAKNTYGQVLAKAKATIEAKAAAATDAISKEAIQSESAAITEELVRLRDANAASFEPREWKSDETKKARAAYAAELKAVQLKYNQDLTNVQRASLAKKAANPDAAVKQAFQQEADLIAEELKLLVEKIKAGKAREPVVTGRMAKGKGSVAIYLTECEPKTVRVGFSKMLVNKTDEKPSPLLDGKPCKRFIWAHAPSSLTYDLTALPGKQKFLAIGYLAGKSNDGVAFIVRVDGVEVFKSNVVDGKKVVSVPVVASIPPGSKVLELVVDALTDQAGDWSYWIEPRLVE
jgi:hypothetical protein